MEGELDKGLGVDQGLRVGGEAYTWVMEVWPAGLWAPAQKEMVGQGWGGVWKTTGGWHLAIQ